MHDTSRVSVMTIDTGAPCKQFLFQFDDTGSLDRPSCVKNVSLLKDKKQGAFTCCKV